MPYLSLGVGLFCIASGLVVTRRGDGMPGVIVLLCGVALAYIAIRDLWGNFVWWCIMASFLLIPVVTHTARLLRRR